MGPCREIYQEGFRIPPVKIVRAGAVDRDVLALLLNNVRTPEEREGDLRRAARRLPHRHRRVCSELCDRYGLPRVQRAASRCCDYSEQMMRAFLATVPPGSYAAEDFLDDDGISDHPVRIAVRITFPRKLSPVRGRSSSISPAARRRSRAASTRWKPSPTRRASMSSAVCCAMMFPRPLG